MFGPVGSLDNNNTSFKTSQKAYEWFVKPFYEVKKNIFQLESDFSGLDD